MKIEKKNYLKKNKIIKKKRKNFPDFGQFGFT